MEGSPLKLDDLLTGNVVFDSDPIRCFVMDNDTKGLLQDYPGHGAGRFRARFKQNAPNENLSKRYKYGSLGYPEVAKDTNGVFFMDTRF